MEMPDIAVERYEREFAEMKKEFLKFREDKDLDLLDEVIIEFLETTYRVRIDI